MLFRSELEEIEADKLRISLGNKMKQINQNAYRLLKLSNNIIDITRLESGVFKLHRYDWNVVMLVEDIFLEAVPLAVKKNIEMIF